MPKISRFSRYSSELKKNVDGDVFYHLERSRSGSSGFFYVQIPTEMEIFTESFEGARSFRNRGVTKKIIEGATADDAEREFIKFVEAYHAANTSSEKVVLYRFKYSSKNKTSHAGSGRMLDGVDLTYEATIVFDWCVAIKRTFGKKITYEPTDKSVIRASSGSRSNINAGSIKETTGEGYCSWIEFPYSEETEAFFAKVYTGMESIMDNLERFVKTKEQALISIKNHQKLLA